MTGLRLIDKFKFVLALAPVAPSAAAPAWVRLDNYQHATIVISGANNGTGSASAITLQQGQSAAGSNAKALAFSEYFLVGDVSAGDMPTRVAVVANTFSTPATASKSWQCVIEVNATDLDVTGLFDWLQVTVGNSANSIISVQYILASGRYPGNFATMPTAVA